MQWNSKNHQLSFSIEFAPIFFRSHLEASSDQWKRLHLSLQELLVWLQLKDDELSRQAPIGGDFPAVQKQNDVHRVGYF
jgi:dystrophin